MDVTWEKDFLFDRDSDRDSDPRLDVAISIPISIPIEFPSSIAMAGCAQCSLVPRKKETAPHTGFYIVACGQFYVSFYGIIII